MNQKLEQELSTSWQERQEYAEQMLPILGKLYRNRSIEISVYGRSLLGASAIDIIKAHRKVRLEEDQKLRLRESWPLLNKLNQMNLAPAHIDLGKLAYAYHYNPTYKNTPLTEFLTQELRSIIDVKDEQKPKDVVLYGFGRIGRLLARLLIERQGTNNKLRLKAIVVRGGNEGDLEKRASLLRRDSVHGPFNGSITIDKEKNAIKANGSYIQVILSLIHI